MALRILHIGKYFPPDRGGMEVFLADLIRAQRAQGIEAFALVHGRPLPGDPAWLLRVPVQFELIHAPLAFGFRRALGRALREFAPDVLHLHMPNNSVFLALTLPAARALPWVVHWHSDVVVSTIRKALAVAYSFYRPLEQTVLERCDRIIATSPDYLAASEPLARWRHKCVVIPLGLDPEGAVADEAARGVIAVAQAPAGVAPQSADLPWQAGRLRLLSIGRLTYYKGFETLIEAVSKLDDVQLLIAGGGERQPALQALIERGTPQGKTPAVALLGEVSEARKHALLASCDIFCLPSRERSEAFGMVLLEAMLHARPCLASGLAGSGMPWLVEQAGCGLLVETGSVPAWQQAVQTLAREPHMRARLGRAGQRVFHDRFTAAACARELLPQYQALTGARPDAHGHGRLLIVVPARDEAATIGALLQSLRAAGHSEVLVIDDHSQDGTGAVAEAAGAHVLRPVLPLGAWGAMQAGIRHAQARGYGAVITMDADGQHEVSQIPLLLAQRGRADLVIGAYVERASPARRVAWRWFTQLTGLDLEDLTSGFRYYSKAAIDILASEQATLLDYQDVGTLLMLRDAGRRMVEVPVEMKLRTTGKSRIFNSWFSVGRYMAITTLLCLSHWRIRAAQRG